MYMVLDNSDVVVDVYEYDNLSRIPKEAQSLFVKIGNPEQYVGAWYNRKTGAFIFPPDYDPAYQKAEWDGMNWIIVDFKEKPPAPIPEIVRLREAKKQEIGQGCTAAIYFGIDVNGQHYSLTDHDQLNLIAKREAIEKGATTVLYHADGELFRPYTAAEILEISEKANDYILHHQIYCNYLNRWIERAEREELDDIKYGVELPPDLGLLLE